MEVNITVIATSIEALMVDIKSKSIHTLTKLVLRSSLYIQDTETSNHKITIVHKLDSSDISCTLYTIREIKQKILENPPVH